MNGDRSALLDAGYINRIILVSSTGCSVSVHMTLHPNLPHSRCHIPLSKRSETPLPNAREMPSSRGLNILSRNHMNDWIQYSKMRTRCALNCANAKSNRDGNEMPRHK